MFKTVRPVMTAEEVKKLLPVPVEIANARARAVSEIADIITGKDKRKLIVIGPCSADSERAVCEYAVKLAEAAEKIKDKCCLVMRVHTQKPRTRGQGYMGMMHDPDPSSGVTDIDEGVRRARSLHLRVIEESGLFTADETVYPETYEYVNDILAYLTVGARSSEDPLHRFVASGADIAVGIKNPTGGSFASLLDGVYAATVKNEFLYCGRQVYSDGNRLAHAVLRGFTDADGKHISNCGRDDLLYLLRLCGEREQKCAVIVDTGHSNSGKDPFKQPQIALNTLDVLKTEPGLNSFVRGFMIESYLTDGRTDGGGYGLSLTDGCLGWAKTERLLYDIAEHTVT